MNFTTAARRCSRPLLLSCLLGLIVGVLPAPGQRSVATVLGIQQDSAAAQAPVGARAFRTEQRVIPTAMRTWGHPVLLAQEIQQNALSPSEIAAGWTVLFDGQSLTGWEPVGDVTWQVAQGTITAAAEKTAGFVRSQQAFGDFDLMVDFQSDGEQVNSGVFIRCSQNDPVTAKTCYEINISDGSPAWPTGSINYVARVEKPETTAGTWNTFEITADGDRLVVRLNGRTIISAHDSRRSDGNVALQSAGVGRISFRNIKLRLRNN